MMARTTTGRTKVRMVRTTGKDEDNVKDDNSEDDDDNGKDDRQGQ